MLAEEQTEVENSLGGNSEEILFYEKKLPGPSLFVHQVGANYHEHDKEISI
ncbi:hypothetical protein ABKV19_027101 [Rosa sericea]